MIEEVPEAIPGLKGVTQRFFQINGVIISPPLAVSDQHPDVLEVMQHVLHGTLGDPDAFGQVPHTQAGIARQTEHDMGLVA